jgi:hypothetical protein
MVVVVPAASRYPAEPPLVGFLCSALLPKTGLELISCMHVESLPGCASFNRLFREFRPLKLSPHDAMASPRGRLRCSGSSALG